MTCVYVEMVSFVTFKLILMIFREIKTDSYIDVAYSFQSAIEGSVI